jgi:cytochrome P450
MRCDTQPGKGVVTTQAEAGPACPVLRFTPEPDGAPPSVLRTSCHGDHAGRPSDGLPLLVLRRTADVLPVLRDARFAMAGVTPARDLTRFPLTGAELQSPDGGLLNMDPPRLRAYRRRLRPLFTSRAAQATVPAVRAIAAELAEGLRGRAQVDARGDFAEPLAAAAVCDAMGVPRADHDLVAAYARTAFAVVPGPLSVPQVADAWRGLYGYYRSVMPHGRGLVGQLAAALHEHTPAQRVHAIGTVSNGFGAVLPVLAVSLAITAGRPAAVGACLRGALGWQTLADRLLATRAMFPVALPRVALADVPLGGRMIPRGTVVLPSLIGSAHDPQVPPPCSIAFGAGPHFCPGASLARLWLAAALEVFWSAFPQARLAGGLEWQAGTLSMPREIPVRLA